MSDLGRNDPCVCGSGKKYKKCCLPGEQALACQGRKPFLFQILPKVDKAVDGILERVERGQRDSAESEMKALLAAHPDYHSVNFGMGVCRLCLDQDHQGAIPFFRKATQANPGLVEAHLNLGTCLARVGDLPNAVASLETVLSYSKPESQTASMALRELRSLDAAVTKSTPFASLRAMVANQKEFEKAFQALTDKKFDTAVEHFKKVLEANPNHVQSHGNLGLAYAGTGKKALALQSLEKALQLDPNYEPASFNRVSIEKMQEGEPRVETIEEISYYRDRLDEKKV